MIIGNAEAAARQVRRMASRHRLSALQEARLVALHLHLNTGAQISRVRLNTNRRTMLSLRGRPHSWTVSMHVGLLDHDSIIAEIPEWVSGRGRTTSAQLRRCLQEVWLAQQAAAAVADGDLITCSTLPTLMGPLSLDAVFSAIHGTWFSHLPKPAVGWSRSSGRRTLMHIRFGAYRRHPLAYVQLNPRLDQPWVARCFVEHVLFHELCHHAQACAPIRGESPHSARFRALERSYPQHAEAQAWERAFLSRLLAPIA
jgi:hypothetical protein